MKTVLAALVVALVTSLAISLLMLPSAGGPGPSGDLDALEAERFRERLATLERRVGEERASEGAPWLAAPAGPRPEVTAVRESSPACDPHCAALRARIDDLDRRLAALESRAAAGPASAPSAPAWSAGMPRRSWGPEQATGAPDTLQAGDSASAWASRTEDAQDEWLLLEYATAVLPAVVLVHENFRPGALFEVSAFDEEGVEQVVWQGQDPTPSHFDQGVSRVHVTARFKTRHLRLRLASASVPGWNEIDAVGLVDTDGSVQWAVAAQASSSYANLQAGTAFTGAQGFGGSLPTIFFADPDR